MEIQLECALCGTNFEANTVHLGALGISQLPKKCPTCLDRIQTRPVEARIIKRECLQSWGGVLIALPSEWFSEFVAQDSDRPAKRAIVKGSRGSGASWSGRIDIYDFRPNDQELGCVRLMHAAHAQGQVRQEQHGVPMGPKDTVRVEYPADYIYLSIDPSEEAEPKYALVWASISYKTTLKGFGRQYHANLDCSNALWAYELSSSARSGRFGNLMAVALVDDSHPVITTQWGDVQSEKFWTLASPLGAAS